MAEDTKSLSSGERKLYQVLQRYLGEGEQLVQWAFGIDMPVLSSLGAFVLSIVPPFLLAVWLAESYIEPRYGDLGLLIGIIAVATPIGLAIFELLSRIVDVGKVYLFGLTNQRLMVAAVRQGVWLKFKSGVTLTSFPLDRIPPISLESKKLTIRIRIHAPEGPIVVTVGRFAKVSRGRIEAIVAALGQRRHDPAPSRNA
jgi:hypothetical protein